MTAKLTQDEFLAKAHSAWGDRYDLSQVHYMRSNVSVSVICRIHGEFLVRPNNFLNNRGCNECGKIQRGKVKSAAAADRFEERARSVHNGKYTYERAVYTKAKQPITITCPEHGPFVTTPDFHLRGVGCPVCADTARTAAKRMSHAEFVAQATQVHNAMYDYSETQYIESHSKVRINCPVHGEFWQTPNSHLAGSGCELCGKKSAAIKLSVDFADFVERANKTHNGKYTYVEESYSQLKEKVDINCKTHGVFRQNAMSHVSGCGCPVCARSASTPELELTALLKAHGIQAVRRDRTILTNENNPQYNKELDIVIPDKNIAIEYCGLFWHSDKYRPDRTSHLKKLEQCAQNGYRLITIFEDEYVQRTQQTISLLKRILNIAELNRIAARRCTVEEMESAEAGRFIVEHHLQGNTKASHYYGLRYGTLLVAVASFSRKRVFMGRRPGHSDDLEMELVRFCTHTDYTILGGLGKLVAHAETALNTNTIFSYVDRRWFTGESYMANGFTLLGVTQPNYWYVKGRSRLSRYNFARHTLEDKHKNGLLPVYSPELSEQEIMRLNGYLRIYDCGNLKLVHHKK